MLLTTMALAAAMTVQAAPEESGRWRILRETPTETIAVQLGERPPRAGDYGTAYLLTTYSTPQPRRSGASFRQRWTELSIECPHETDRGHYGEVWNWVAEPGTPLPKDDGAPPIAIRSFDYGTFGPLALALCNGEAADGAVIEGDWATVLNQLLARNDARSSS